MGLGVARKRAKLSHDPNNTAWSRSSERYGHKIMLSQGWTPGSSLGIKNGVDKDCAIASNPLNKVGLRNDNRGMGVMHGENNGEGRSTGLDVFQGILGRLNGKPKAELEVEQRPSKYITSQKERWEFSYFVSGGFLAGENPQKPPQGPQSSPLPSGKPSQTPEQDALQGTQTINKDNFYAEQSIPIKYKRRRHRSTDVKGNKATTDGLASRQTSSAERPILTTPSMATRSITPTITSTASIDAHKAHQRLKKANRKLDCKKEKADKKTLSIELSQECSAPQILSTHTDSLVTESRLASSQPSLGTSQPMIGRLVARQRYIRYKKMATIDIKALNEILMVKE